MSTEAVRMAEEIVPYSRFGHIDNQCLPGKGLQGDTPEAGD